MKILYFSIGSLSLSLGLIGIIIPILPTTPFLILSSLCFIRSNKRAYDYLYKNKYVGPYLQHYYTKQGVYLEEKKKAYIFLWVSISISILLISSFMMKVLLLIIAICVTIHISLIKTKVLKYEQK